MNEQYEGAYMNKKTKAGDTALHLAARNNDYRRAEVLLKRGAESMWRPKMTIRRCTVRCTVLIK